MEFQIDSNSSSPIYSQLREQFREAVARGQIEPGARMPSVRDLSRRLVVNPNTIARAYRELELEGLLLTRQGVGVFVAQPKAELTQQVREKRLVEAVDQFLTEAIHLRFSQADIAEIVAERAEGFRW
jgi:GntR family transcriptional regulator